MFPPENEGEQPTGRSSVFVITCIGKALPFIDVIVNVIVELTMLIVSPLHVLICSAVQVPNR